MVPRLPFARYLLLWAMLGLGFIGAAATANLIVDPYDLHGWLRANGFNEIKPHAGANGPMVKAYQVQRVRAKTLVLGNSRAEVGFDPASVAWPQVMRPVFNLALPGTGPITSLRYLQHAIAIHKPTAVVLGVDFMDFLVNPDDIAMRVGAGSAAIERRLLVSPAGTANPLRHLQWAEDMTASTLSLKALAHSVATVAAQRSRFPAHLTPEGFNPMHDYEGIARREGYYVMFRQRDEENARAYMQRPKAIYQRGTATSPQFDVVRRMMLLCADERIDLHLVVYPYHAHLLETFHAAGLWPQFEEWKRALARLVTAAAAHAPVNVRLWDFSGYGPMATEPVPAPGDRRTATRWYWEAGHFKKELGDAMLTKMFNTATQGPDSQFGVELRVDNIESELERVRHERLIYLQSNTDTVKAIEALMLKVRTRERRD